MFKDMQQFLSSDVCLSCEGCCRFDKNKSDWRPKIGKSEEPVISDYLVSSEKIATRLVVEKGGYLEDKLCHGMYACKHFNPEDTTCGIYEVRPFECRLYPFVLTRLNNKVEVSVHLTCPYVQRTKDTREYYQYVEYLKEFFNKPEVGAFLKNNLHLFGKYSGYEDELLPVFAFNP